MAFSSKDPVDLETVRIDGERIYLQALDERFAEAIFSEFTAEITRYMGPKPAANIDETLAFIRGAVEGMRGGRDLVAAIICKDDDQFLGVCGLHGQGRGQGRIPELGIWLKKSAHGRGYGREAIWTLVRWAVEKLQIDHFIYPVDRANTPSRKIPESLGGTIFAEQRSKTMWGGELDEVIYRVPGAKPPGG
ncbi:MAG: GNAT family N-acetyltransferase [Candidatus Latescibacteria bacterium]|nr:GNAT family N-acetyltransferase [Candidatus Latescibacterota bacterium]